MKRLLFIPITILCAFTALAQSIHTHNSTNDMVAASFNPSSQNTNHYVLTTNDMSYQHWVWWSGDTSAASTYNLESLRPGVVGRFKLVENLHWNHIPDVNGDTFVIINNTNQSGLIGALTVPYIPYASGTNKLRDSHLYWMTNGTGTDTNLYFGPGTTNVLYRTGNSLVLTNAGKTNGFEIINTNGTKLRLGFLDNGSAPRLTTPAAAIWLGNHTVFEGNAVPDQDNTRGIGTAASTGAWADFFQKGSHYLEAFNDGLGTNVVWLRSFMSNKTAIINFVSQTNGVNGDISGISVRTNGVEVFSVTGTGGPSSGANWTAVGTTDSSLAGTATVGQLHSSFSQQLQPRGIWVDNTINDIYGGSILLRHIRGVSGAIVSGDQLGAVCFSGYDGTQYQEHEAIIKTYASENFVAGANYGTEIRFDVTKNNTGYAPYTAMVLGNDGKLGIGTTVPVELLDVTIPYGKTDTGDRVFAFVGKSNDSANYSGLQMFSHGGASQAVRKVALQTQEAGVINDGYLLLQPSGGNVGIRDLNPSESLSVGGNIKTSGSVIIAGTTNQVIFGSTNTAPVSSAAPTKWISVQVSGEATVYRLPLYE